MDPFQYTQCNFMGPDCIEVFLSFNAEVWPGKVPDPVCQVFGGAIRFRSGK